MSELAVITGASRGLGSVLATVLAGRGSDLVLTARDEEALDAKAESIAAAGIDVEIHTIAGNVADPDHRRAVRRVVAENDGLDVLVNNASALGPSPLPSLAEYPLEELERVFSVNVVAPLGFVGELLPFLEARQGLVVNITSDAAREGYPG